MTYDKIRNRQQIDKAGKAESTLKYIFVKVVFTDYRLLPENKYPVPVEDCCCMYQWILDYAEMLGIHRDKIVVAGGGAGGNLAAAVTLML
jgi:acetyl esterase/lipase